VRSKASYFSISAPLIKENLRRFWAVPVLAFLVYFLSGVFPILMSYKNLGFMASYIQMSLHNMQPFFMGAHLFVPVITAVILYRYLQNVSSVAVMHSMPFTRAKLFNSNFITGLILISAPVVLNGIILLLLSKPTYRQWGYGESLTISPENVFARAEVLNWLGTSLLIVFVLFSVAVFAAIVTGNNLMHLMTSYFFIFLIPLLYAVFNVYFQLYLFGFDLSGNWMDICLSISPYTAIINGRGYFSTYEVLYYIGTIFAMLVISAVLYNKRKLERASDSLAFGFMKPVICYIIAFLGMTMLGFYFQELGEERIYLYAGFAAGTVIFFIIGQMIVMKTARVFNKEGLKSFAVYALIAIVFLAGLNLDITGFESRVPKTGSINSTGCNTYFNSVMLWRSHGDDKEPMLSSPENIEAVKALHRSIIDNKARLDTPRDNLYVSSLQIRYDTKGIFDMSRRYDIDYMFLAESPYMKQIFESAEYKNKNSFYIFKTGPYKRANIYSEIPASEKEGEKSITDPRLLKELISCLEEDFVEMKYEDIISLRPNYTNIEIQYTYSEEEEPDRAGEGYINIRVPQSARKTINWLKAHGYSFDLTADMVERIDIYVPRGTKSGHEYRKEVFSTETADIAESSRPPIVQITDKEKIDKILQSYHTNSIDLNTAYEISILYRPKEGGRDVKTGDSGEYQYISGYLNQTLESLD